MRLAAVALHGYNPDGNLSSQENPFFVPPEQYLNEMRERRLARATGA